MSLRSFLFVPGDSDKKLAKSASVPADVLILDLEDSVAASNKAVARHRVREFIEGRKGRGDSQLWVRINPLDGPEAGADLAAVMSAAPAGIVQPKTQSAEDVIRLGQQLDELEAQFGISPGSTRILPVATETPAAIFNLGTYVRCGDRLYGLTWGAEDLSAAVGASGNKLPDGTWTSPYMLARSLCLFGACAAGVAPVDTLFSDFRDAAGLRTACADSRRDGFTGKLAIHPDQVAVINESFTPSAAELAWAAEVVGLFQRSPGVGALALNGQMLDLPHLKQAERMMARAAPRVTSS